MTEDDPNDRLDEILTRVERYLGELFGAESCHRWSDCAFMRVVDGQVVFLVVSPFHDDVVVNVRSYVVRDVQRPDAMLGDHLARINAEQLFGSFSIDEDGDVCVDHTLLGSALTMQALRLAIEAVASSGSHHGPEIIQRWGGLSSLEKLRLEAERSSERAPGSEEGDDQLN